MQAAVLRQHWHLDAPSSCCKTPAPSYKHLKAQPVLAVMTDCASSCGAMQGPGLNTTVCLYLQEQQHTQQQDSRVAAGAAAPQATHGSGCECRLAAHLSSVL
jgi:hypothetical protein